ncbi:MAG: DUF433 domain-containing protein [Chitinophagales bacterium]|nr:DUF433 domain-containing protein [Chitinophagales bacterium]
MKLTFRGKSASAKIGEGIYSAADAARIFRIPYSKAQYWFKYYAKNKLFDSIGYRYHFEIRDIVAVNFLSLIEMYVFYSLKDENISIHEIVRIHQTMAEHLNTPYPFANQDISVLGKNVFFGASYTNAKNLQSSLAEFIVPLAKKIEFGDQRMAKKFYPLGISKSIVVNPENQFGQPIIEGTNILAETIYDYYLAGESIGFIAKLYKLDSRKVEDAIAFCAPLPKAA